MKIVRNLVSEILKEDAYKKKTGHRFTDDIKLIKDSLNKPGYFLHFTDIPKIGVFPGSSYMTGVYFYPNTREIYKDFVTNSFSMARGASRSARYVYLVKIKPNVKILDGADAIKEASRTTLRKILSPILDGDLNLSLISNESVKAGFMRAAFEKIAGFSLQSIPEHEYPTIEEMKESGLLSYIEQRNEKVKEAQEILLRSKIKGEDEEARIKLINQKIGEAIGDIANVWDMHEITLNASRPLGEQRTKVKKTSDKLSSFYFPLLPAKLESLSSTLQKGFNPLRNNSFSNFPMYTMKLLQETALLYCRASAYLKTESKYNADGLTWLDIMLQQKEQTVFLNGGKQTTTHELANSCLKSAESIFSPQGYKRFRQFLKARDSVGINIMLATAGQQYDGINDPSTLGKETLEKINSEDYKGIGTTDGKSGVLGVYESQQLFLFAPLSNKIEIVTMIDRFEGAKEVPGDKTPDREDPYQTPDPRVKALKSRIFKDPDNSEKANAQRKERWQ
jgi:hypothetical protein